MTTLQNAVDTVLNRPAGRTLEEAVQLAVDLTGTRAILRDALDENDKTTELLMSWGQDREAAETAVRHRAVRQSGWGW